MAAYTPASMVADLAAGVGDVLPYVGAGVGGGVVLMFAFLGIRAGFRFFGNLTGSGHVGNVNIATAPRGKY